MEEIKNILLNILENISTKFKININEFIKIKFSENKKFGHCNIYGFRNILKKKILNNCDYNLFINEFLLKSKKIHFINSIDIIDNNFINIFFKISWIELKLKKMLNNKKLNISTFNSENIIVDYSSPNMSKEMHIGHLRSMVLGDSYSRIAKFLGHNVIKINHIGDWGINFGMIICKLKEDKINENKEITIKKLEKIYIESKKKYKYDKNFKKMCHCYLNKLISNKKNITLLWKKIINCTLKNNQKIYDLLNIKLNINNVLGESYYQKFLPLIINDLKKKKIAIKKNKLIIIPLKNFKNKKGENMGVIIKKEDGSYLYSAIEIASIRYRCKYLFADRLIYYVDIRQKNHLLQSFQISKMAKYINKNVKLENHFFGMILNKNNTPFKTRDGNSIKLIDLINECLNKAKEFIYNKNKKLNISEINKLSNIIGIGSLKYMDLSKNKLTNYIIDWNKMFSLKDNTLIYIQYSYIRICSIFKKNNIKNISNIKYFKYPNIRLLNPEEIEIGIFLINFEETIKNVFKFGTPNILCLYIYKLTLLFSNFYKKHLIIHDDLDIKINRLNLILLIAKTIKISLHLLGINIPEKM